jgi:hypothetical protein
MTALAIAADIAAWLALVLLCLGLARSAALGDAMISRKTRRRRGLDHEAA